MRRFANGTKALCPNEPTALGEPDAIDAALLAGGLQFVHDCFTKQLLAVISDGVVLRPIDWCRQVAIYEATKAINDSLS